MSTPNASSPIRELVISQRHIHRRQLGRLLHPADRLILGNPCLQSLDSDAAVHEERRVRVAGRNAVDANTLLDDLARHAVDHAPQPGLGDSVGDRARGREQARDRVGDDDGGARAHERGRGLDDMEGRVEVDLQDVIPHFRGHFGYGIDLPDGSIIAIFPSVPRKKEKKTAGYFYKRIQTYPALLTIRSRDPSFL